MSKVVRMNAVLYYLKTVYKMIILQFYDAFATVLSIFSVDALLDL
jgi:hypothetical protein